MEDTCRKPNLNHPAHSVVPILTLKTTNTLTSYLAANLMKQVNEKQPTKTAVVVKVKLSDLQEPSSWSKAAYWGLEFILSKRVQNKIQPSSIRLWHNEFFESGVSRVPNVAVSQLKWTKINSHISSSSDPVIIPTLVVYLEVVTAQSCGVRTVSLCCNSFLHNYNQSDVKSVLLQITNDGTKTHEVEKSLEAKNIKLFWVCFHLHLCAQMIPSYVTEWHV